MEEITFRLISFIIAFVSIVVYGIYMYKLFDITKSISITYEHLKRLSRTKGIFFRLAMYTLGIFMAFAGSTYITVLAGAGLLFTGTAAATSSGSPMTVKVHVVGSVSTVILAITSVWLDFGFWYLSVAATLAIAYMMYFEVKNRTYWIEWLTIFVASFAILHDIIETYGVS